MGQKRFSREWPTIPLNFQFGLLVAFHRIHVCCTGSGDGIEPKNAVYLRNWLNWRLTDGWDEPSLDRCAPFENRLRELGVEVLKELDAYILGFVEPLPRTPTPEEP